MDIRETLEWYAAKVKLVDLPAGVKAGDMARAALCEDKGRRADEALALLSKPGKLAGTDVDNPLQQDK